jgi:peptide/nickel transport system permease protein
MRISNKYIITYSLIVLFFVTGIFNGFIANEKPLICTLNGSIIFPVLDKDFRHESAQKIILRAPVKYSHYSVDIKNTGSVSPFATQNLEPGQQRHILGTDLYGRDVLAGMIYGTSIAVKVGLGSMILAFLLGMLMSLFSSYYGDYGLKMRSGHLLILISGIAFLLYFLTYFDYFMLSYEIPNILSFILLFLLMSRLLPLLPYFKRRINIPVDTGASVFTGVFQSMPSGFLILILISLFAKTTLFNIILVIGLLKWPGIARYVRAEVLKVKQERFVEASKVLGLKDRLIIFRHILPYTFTPVFIALSYGFAGSILLESTLSFLGIGTPADHVSWGTLLGEARQDFSAWWLAIFPGIAIFTMIFIFNRLGEKFSVYSNQ